MLTYAAERGSDRDEEICHMGATEPKTLDLETEDVTPRSWEELVNDLLDSDPTPDVYVGGCGCVTCSGPFCGTSSVAG
jgi:hypothetical protein